MALDMTTLDSRYAYKRNFLRRYVRHHGVRCSITQLRDSRHHNSSHGDARERDS